MAKIGILPNFIQRPKINYSTYEKIISGELKGPFELHLDVIWGSEDQKLKNPPPFYLSHDFERFLSDFVEKISI